MKLTKLIIFAVIALTMSITPALAAKHSVGLGVGAAPDYEGSEDYEAVPMVMLSGRYDSGRSFTLLGTRLFIDVLATKDYFFGPVLNYRMGRDDVDNQFVDAMSDIDDAFEAGLYAGFNINNFIVAIEALADVSDTHEGTIAKIAADYKWEVSDSLNMTPGIFATYASDDYMDTYFGVNAANVGTSGFPNYKAEAGIKDAGVNLIVNYSTWANWGVMGIASYKSLLNDAEDSPVVKIGDDGQAFIGLMAIYKWGNN
ncbi:MAG: MipA/OmpV family protein [Flavobacteriaceae bacterium]|jgi:outer membrane protein|nr:MAG: MipA/OmpV family protein [Flavobacteriaceae bacterium]